jgi:hypothetical protein
MYICKYMPTGGFVLGTMELVVTYAARFKPRMFSKPGIPTADDLLAGTTRPATITYKHGPETY